MPLNVGEVEAVLRARDQFSEAFVNAAQRVLQLNNILKQLGDDTGPQMQKVQAALAEAEAECTRLMDAGLHLKQSLDQVGPAAGTSAARLQELEEKTRAATVSAEEQAAAVKAQAAAIDASTAATERANAAQQAAAAAGFRPLGALPPANAINAAQLGSTFGSQAAEAEAVALTAVAGASTKAKEGLDEVDEATKRTGQSMSQVEGLAQRMIERMIILWAIRGAAEFVAGIYEAANAMVLLHEQTGLSLAMLQELQYGADKTSVPIEKLDSAIQSFDKNLAELKPRTVDTLATLGFSLDSIFKMRPDDRLNAITDAIAQMPSHLARSSAEIALFGTDAIDPLIKRFQQLREEAIRNNKVLSDETVDSLAITARAFKQLTDQLKEWGAEFFVGGANLIAAAATPFFRFFNEGTFREFPRLQPVTGIGPAGNLSGYTGLNISVQEPAGGPSAGQAFIDQLRAQSQEMRPLTEQQRVWLGQLKEMNQLTADNAAHLGVTSTQYREYTESLKGTTAGARAWNEAELEIQQAQRGQVGLLQDMGDAARNWYEYLIKLGVSDSALRTEYGLSNMELKALHEEMKGYDEVAKTASTTRPIHGLISDLQSENPREELRGVTKDLDDLWKEIQKVEEGKPLEGPIKGMLLYKPQVHDFMKEWKQDLTELTQAFRDLATVAGGELGTIAKDIAVTLTALNVVVKGIDTFEKGRASGSFIQEATGLISAGAGFIQAVSQGGVAGIAGGAITGAEIGSDFGGPVGAAIGGAIGGVIGLIGAIFHDRLPDDIARDAGRNFGQVWSANLQSTITANARSFHDELAGEIASIPDIIKEHPIDISNLIMYEQKARDIFVMIGMGHFTVSDATKDLDAVFPQLAAAATDAYGRISRELKEIISLSEQYGVSSKAIADWQKAQASTVLSAASAIAGGVLNKGANASELGDVGSILIGGFVTAVATGTSKSDAIKSETDALTELEKEYKDLGITVTDTALKTLFFENDMQQKNPTLIAGVQGLSQEMVGLDNLGLETRDRFEEQERVGARMYERLANEAKSMGGTADDALILMQDYLHNAQIEAARLGVPLDDNTQSMIDQSKALGIWDANAKPVKDTTEKLADAVQRLVDWLDRIPTSVRTTVTTDFQTTGTPPPGSSSNGTSESTPQPGTGLPGSAGPGEGLAEGGIVQYRGIGGRILPFYPRGTDTQPAMLTPGEGVVTVAGMGRIGAAGLTAINSGIRGLFGGGSDSHDTYHISVQVVSASGNADDIIMALRSPGTWDVLITELSRSRSGESIKLKRVLEAA